MDQLTKLAKQFDKSIKGQTVLLVQDTDGDFAVLYRLNGRIAFQFRDGYCPIISPAMTYEVKGLVPIHEALPLLEVKA
jgi:hypothetical protein